MKTILILSCIAVLVFAWGCGGEGDAPPPRIAEWKGSGSLQTETFTMESPSWVIDWQFKSVLGLEEALKQRGVSTGVLGELLEGDDGFFTICVQPTPPTDPCDMRVTTLRSGRGAAPVRQDGTFNLIVVSTGDWTIGVSAVD